jgi:YYY domain-containing protein
MISLFLWYLIISILGLAAFPLVYHFLPALEDRGYALSRILGLLLWGYLFWLLGSLGILKNDLGGELFVLLVLILSGGWVWKTVGRGEIWGWLRRHLGMIITVEVLFLLAFIGWAFVRSTNPDIVGTEKPMELAFLNSILRSPTLPPNDPWLSGYSISYYYFGYVLITMIARLAGTSASMAFNLGVSLIFALGTLGSYSVVYNLLSRQGFSDKVQQITTSVKNARSYALLGPFFVLIVSNFGGLLHILRLVGAFWRVDETGQQVSRVWAWLDMGRYSQPPPAEAFPHWWWWQASRIVQDFDFTWANKGDIIDEFPFFSFLLADLHPHVLAMPFAFLAISLALNLFLSGASGRVRWLWMRFKINPAAFVLASVVLGALAFFNTWDFPFYVALFAGAYVLRETFFEDDRETTTPPISLWRILGRLTGLGFALGVSGAVLYLPFYFGFQSQAGGLLPNLIYITRGVYLWIHFIPLLLPIFGLLFYLWRLEGDRFRLRLGIKLTLGIVGLLVFIQLVPTLIIANLKFLDSLNPQAATAGDAFLDSLAAPGWWPMIFEGLKRRVAVPGTFLTISTLLSLTIALIVPRKRGSEQQILTPSFKSYALPQTFSLLLILVGALLVLAPEFVYLRDLFGYRINTIFKFYFQVWLMWGVAAAYSVVQLERQLKGTSKVIFRAGLGLLLVLSLTYPVMGLWSKTNGLKPFDGFTLDGTAYLERSNPDEDAAMEWLQAAPLGVVAEAIGGSYSQYARMASNSGQPTVLGWDFHELQWRGGNEEMGSRRADIERMYCTNQWTEAENILRQYHVSYVVVGDMEQAAYGTGSKPCPQGLSEVKFIRNLPLVFQSGTTSIYQVPEIILAP